MTRLGSFVLSSGLVCFASSLGCSSTPTANEGNRAPQALDDAAESQHGVAIDIDVLANDSDPDGDSLAVGHINGSVSGSATLNADQTIHFEPEAGFEGSARFHYTAVDGRGGEDTATARISPRRATWRTISVARSPCSPSARIAKPRKALRMR